MFIAEALDEKLANSLGSSLAKLVTAVDSLRADRQDSNEAFLTNIVDDFKKSISGAAGDEMRSLADSLSRLDELLQGSATNVAEKIDAAGQAAASTMEKTSLRPRFVN